MGVQQATGNGPVRGAAAALLSLAGLLCAVQPAAGQRLLDDWLVRTSAAPPSLQAGATAALWNPAGVGEQRTLGTLSVLELLAPSATGVDGFSLNGGWRLDERTTFAAAYQHFAVGGIDYTETSPDGGTPIDVSQDLFAAAASRRVGRGLQVGGSAQYLRSSEALDQSGELSIGAGARVSLPLPVATTAAAYAQSVRDRLLWGAGLELAPKLPLADWQGALVFGVGGGRAATGTTYRAGLTAGWRGMVEVAGSVVSEPDASSRTLQPVLSAELHVNRYELGVVREWLPNSFGTVHTFRFGVAFP